MRVAVTRTLYRQLLGMWIARDTTPIVTQRKLMLAFAYDMKDASLALARQVLDGDGGALDARPYALLALGRYGSIEDLPRIERYFSDEKVCVKHRFNRRDVQVQVREVALAVAARLTKQDPKSYGFDRLQPHPTLVYLAGSLALADDAARVKAFHKWDEWKAARARGEIPSPQPPAAPNNTNSRDHKPADANSANARPAGNESLEDATPNATPKSSPSVEDDPFR